MNNELLKLVPFANTSYRKCECCSRVRDIYYRLNVGKAEMPKMLVGSFELCRDCGENLGSILNQDTDSAKVVTDFNFDS